MLTGISKTSKTTQRVFLEKQIPLNESELQLAADKLSDYKEKSGILQLTEKSSTLVTQIAYFDVKEEPLKLNKISNNEILDKFRNELAGYSIVLPSVFSLTVGDTFKELKKSYSSANTELLMYNLAYAGELVGVKSNSDDLTKTSILSNIKKSTSNKMLDEINKNLFKYSNGDAYVNEILSEYGKATLEIVKDDIELLSLGERAQVYNDELDKLPLIERRVTDLERNVIVLQQVGLDLRSMLEQVKLTEAAVSGNVTVIDYAEIPLQPISPNKLLIMAVALLLGMALGFLMCILANLLDNTLNSREDVRKTVGDNIPLLGWVPLITSEKKILNKDDIEKSFSSSSIPVYTNPTFQISEKFMSIASNIIYGKTLLNNQVMSITSCDMSSGKSSAISNIAMCLAQMGSKVIIVDGDFRRPSVLSMFGYSRPEKGSVEVVLGDNKLEEVIVQPIPEVDNLHVLPVGRKPQVPLSIFAHPEFSEMLSLLREHYDYILIDAPPLDYAAEVLFLGKISDTCLINVRAGITTKESLKELLFDLEPIKESINGVILNGFIPSKADRGGSANGKYGYRYGHGYASYVNANNDGNDKLVTQSMAKRMQINSYKGHIKNREERDRYYQKLTRLPNFAHNLNFKAKSERTQNDTFNNSSKYNSNDSEGFKENFEDDIKNNIKKKEPTGSKSKSKNTYSSIIDIIKKDSDSSGKKN